MDTVTPTADIPFAIAASPQFRQDGVAFCARASGLYRTQDGGRTWAAALDALQLSEPLPTLAICFAPNFATTGTVFVGAPGAVLRSTDGGATWVVRSLPFRLAMVSTLMVSPNFEDDGVVLTGTVEDGVFRSSDRGDHWSAWNFGLLDLQIMCLTRSPDFAHDETLLAGVDSGLFRSTNGGRAWREVPFPTDLAPVISVALVATPTPSGVIFAGTEAHGLWASHDDGATWQPVGAGQLAGPTNALIVAADFVRQPHLLALVDTGLWVTRDAGQTWNPWKKGRSGHYRCVAAGQGLAASAPLLVGLDTGMARI